MSAVPFPEILSRFESMLRRAAEIDPVAWLDATDQAMRARRQASVRAARAELVGENL